ncbi:peptidoglycan D,D-transpeptidase FtsI family protein [Caulobacter mirabilis]|uniref:Penicillin-binding protein n=1 Tax=Caulobacter mirabilis TaxID=69666 RepID=A0A2D2B0P1_9CAUL|nr:penicillin-binding protein 2 [Caulobacter mirabilis]ATQ43806.1 penicillin-binding protein [Caulobacter mirabilis]
MSIPDLAPQRYPALWRWIIERVWRVEHAFERAHADGKAENDTRIRIFVVLALFLVGFTVMAGGAVYSAVLSDAGQGGRAYAGVPKRADLVDREGRLLAANLTHYTLSVDVREMWSKRETREALLKALPRLTAKQVDKALSAQKRGVVLRGLTPAEKARVHDLGLPGVVFDPEERRVYPLGALASHLLGYDEKGGDPVAGAEKALAKDILAAGAEGKPVALSIDVRVQAAVEEELAAAAAEYQPKGAVGLVTDVQTGEILAMASWPDFDPNAPGRATPEQLRNRAAASVFEMGSTFKAFTVAIGLDAHVASPDSTFDATQPLKMGYRTIHDFHGTNRILTLREVFNHSSNIGTARLALAVGPERMERYFQALGLTKRAQVELLESTRPLTPKKWDEDDMASVSFGHGINVSPLALAQAMGAILNGGRMIPLTIRKLPADLRPQGERVMSEQTAISMLQIMRGNVVGGTGRKADAPGLMVGGKTGTGEKYDPEIRGYSHYKQVGSFAAVFPTDGPVDTKRYFVLVLMDEPQGAVRTGGWVAAPAVGRIINRIGPFLGVERRPEEPKAATIIAAGPAAAQPETGL